MLGLKFNHISKRGPRSYSSLALIHWCMVCRKIIYRVYPIEYTYSYAVLCFLLVIYSILNGFMGYISGLILGMHQANERRCCDISPFLIGWYRISSLILGHLYRYRNASEVKIWVKCLITNNITAQKSEIHAQNSWNVICRNYKYSLYSHDNTVHITVSMPNT